MQKQWKFCFESFKSIDCIPFKRWNENNLWTNLYGTINRDSSMNWKFFTRHRLWLDADTWKMKMFVYRVNFFWIFQCSGCLFATIPQTMLMLIYLKAKIINLTKSRGLFLEFFDELQNEMLATQLININMTLFNQRYVGERINSVKMMSNWADGEKRNRILPNKLMNEKWCQNNLNIE